MTPKRKLNHDEFEALYQQHIDYAIRFGASRLRSLAAAEDVAHNVFANIWENGIPEDCYGGKERAYINTSVAYGTIDYFRRCENRKVKVASSFRQKDGDEDYQVLDIGALTVYNPLEAHHMAGEERNAVRNTLMKMLDRYPDHAYVLQMHYFMDFSLAEIGQRVGATRQAIKSRLFRARNVFRQLYPEEAAAA